MALTFLPLTPQPQITIIGQQEVPDQVGEAQRQRLRLRLRLRQPPLLLLLL